MSSSPDYNAGAVAGLTRAAALAAAEAIADGTPQHQVFSVVVGAVARHMHDTWETLPQEKDMRAILLTTTSSGVTLARLHAAGFPEHDWPVIKMITSIMGAAGAGAASAAASYVEGRGASEEEIPRVAAFVANEAISAAVHAATVMAKHHRRDS